MSTKAPTPFGAPQSKPPSTSGYPPISSKVSTPFGSSSKTKSAVDSSTVYGFFGFKGDPAEMSKAGAKLVALTEKMEKTIARVSGIRGATAANSDGLEKKIQNLVEQIQQTRLLSLDADTSLVTQRQENAFLLSRKTDSSRHVNEARHLVETYLLPNDKGAAELAETQPLDYESEQNRRKFAAIAISVWSQMKVLNDRCELLQTASNSTEEGPRELLQGIMDLYTKTKMFDEAIGRIEGKVSEASKAIPLQQAHLNRTVGRTTYGLTPKTTPSKRERLRPISFPSAFSSPPPKGTQSGKAEVDLSLVDKWNGIESSLQQIGCEHASTVRLGGLSKLSNFHASGGEKKKTIRRNLGPSLLLSPAEKTYMAPSTATSRSITVFSPPSTSKPRTGWDRASNIDQHRAKQMSLSLPRELKEVTVSGASRDTLAALGTTPEKVKASLDLKRSEGAVRTPPRPQKGPSSSSSSAGSQLQTPSDPKNAPAAAFPPLPAKAPTPFSQKSGKPGGTSSSKSSDSSSYPPLSDVAPKPFSSQTPTSQPEPSKSEPKPVQGAPSAEKASPKKDAPSGFGDMQGLGNSLFSLGGGTDSSKIEDPATFSAAKPTTTEGSSTPDYKQMLHSFYQKHNPPRLVEVDKTLEKYRVSGIVWDKQSFSSFGSYLFLVYHQGREQEMFRKLGAKYKVPSPLDSALAATQTGSSAPSAPPASFSSAAPAPSPFASSGGAMSTISPFGASSASTAPTPFGSTPAGSLSSSSPFGKPSTPGTPFGSGGLSSAAPFGGNTPTMAQASPFGTSAPAAPAMQAPATQQTFQGRNPREMLVSFYQQKNPSKVAEVDKFLQKYRGNEEQMFRNLAKKYQLDPSVFGLPAAPAGGFGSPPAAPGPTSFGQQSTLGAGASPFGQSSGFGQPSSLGAGGGSMGSTGHTFGAGAGAGAAFGASSFGTLSQSSNPSPFGASSGGGFGSPAPAPGFGASPGGFGGASPFGAPRR
jgi:hypothetical protein